MRYSERYTGTDMVYLAKGGAWLAIRQFVSLTLLFLLSVAYANWLAPEIYGKYKYILSVAGILGALSLSGMNTAVAKAIAQGKNNSLHKAFLTQIKWGALQFLVMLPAAYYYFSKDNIAFALSMLIIGSLVPLMNSSNTYMGALTGKKDFKTFSIYGILTSLSSTALLFFTVLMTNNFVILALIYFLSNTAANLFFYFKTIKKFQIPKESEPETISYGKHLSLINLLPAIAFYIDGVLIFHYLGATNLAIYNFAIAIPEQIKGVLKNIMTLAFPKFSGKKAEEVKISLKQKNRIFFVFIVTGVIIYIIIVPYVFKLFFPGYFESIFYSQIFSLSLLAMPNLLSRTALYSQSAKKALYTLNISSSVIQIIITFILIYRFGIIGAVISKIISGFIDMFLSSWLVENI